MATRQQLEEAVDANRLSYNRFMTVQEAIEAGDERPGIDLIRSRQEAWKRFWNRRGRVLVDHDCGTEMGDGCQVCFRNQETAH